MTDCINYTLHEQYFTGSVLIKIRYEFMSILQYLSFRAYIVFLRFEHLL